MDVVGLSTSLREAIDRNAEVHTHSAFLISPETGKTSSFQEIKQHSILLSKMLRLAGLEKGDKVAFLMDNGLLTAQLFLGAMYGGFVAVPLNVRAGVSQLTYMLDHSDASVVFVEEQYADLLREASSSVRRSIRAIAANADGPLHAFETSGDDVALLPIGAADTALLMYSSGSTGKPKAAIHTHSSILAHGRNSIEAHQLSLTDRSLLVLPLYHINAECVTLIPTLLSGGSVVVAHRFVVSTFWDCVDDFQVTWSALVPTIISELVDWDDPGKDRRQAAFQRIRFFRSSSAPLSPTLHRQFLDKFDLPLLQAMGSTEGGNVFSNPLPPGENKIGSPGLPWGFEARIVDRDGVDVGQGESGEVLLRGAALMKGYYKDPEGTAAVVDSEGWLHTGDLARQDEDGYFFIVGRSKELIIKGGVNIAPRQIDEVLESHPAVLEAAAVGVPDRYFGEDAVAFVVLRPEPAADERELLAFCETRLGHFKTPSRIHFLKELPKGPSGKVQRLRLLDPAVLSSVAVSTHPEIGSVASSTTDQGTDLSLQSSEYSIERIIAAAWAEVLGVPNVDPEANFFALGGHSLLAIQCLSKLREKLPMVLSIADFFENGTVTKQAEVVRCRLRLAKGTEDRDFAGLAANWEQTLLQQYVPPRSEDVIPRLGSTLPHPLSPAQQRIWFMELLNPSVPVYNESESVLLTGELNIEALEQAFHAIVDRHEVLRSTIDVIDEVPHSVIHERWPVRFKTIDLGELPQLERQAELDRLLIDEPRALYDLRTEPGIRVTVIRLSAREHVMILMMHHIICDWASEGIIWRELSALYGSYLGGKPAVLNPLPVTHRDYVAWQHHKLADTDFAEDLAFWEETLRGAQALLDLPADRSRPPVMTYEGKRLRWNLDRALTEDLRNASRQEKTSLFTIFASALSTLLYRYTGNEDILLGIPLADRDRPELQSVVGFLLHTHVLRTKLSHDMTFRDLLSRVQKGVVDLYMHRSAPFEQIVQRLQPERNLSYTPLFQVMLNWRDRDQQLPFIGLDGLAIKSLMSAADTSKFDLFVFVTDNGDEICLEMEYNTDLFDEDRMARMLRHFQTLLAAIPADPGKTIAQAPLLTADEYRRTVVEWNRTETSYPNDKCLDELIQEQVERTPDAVAVVYEGDRLTYRQLEDRTTRLAEYLRGLGVGSNTLVAICVERSLEMVVGLLGILKAGGAYLPLDPTFPVDRLAFMLEDAQPLLVLTQETLRAILPPRQAQMICLDQLSATALDRPGSSVRVSARQAEDLAYVLYTSGSTGRPKGVQVQHRALVNFLTSMQYEPGMKAEDVMLAITTLSFDIAGLELYLPLVVGACVVVASSKTARDGNQLLAFMKESKATIMQATPATWRMLLDSGWQGSPGLKVLCGGESWGAELAGELLPRCQSLWNMYGPTETTIWSSVTRVERDKSVLIGQPIANTTFYILDSCGQPLPVGVPGELYIGGAGLALGYLGRADLTNERFVADPFCSQPGARLYRTGDLVRRVADGSIEFLGRVDDQIKLRGFRIELGEIEVAIEKEKGIRQCAITVQQDDSAGKRLVAHVVPTNPGVVPKVSDLSRSLKQRLPDYMIPSIFTVIERIPLTPNGKIDRKALSQSKLKVISNDVPVEVPRDSVEVTLVEIWEELLEIRPVGIKSNYFELGGHSLLVARLFARINQTFHRSLPIASIFSCPTIEQLATVIRGRTIDSAYVPAPDAGIQVTANSAIVPLQPHGSATPLFIVHGVKGDIVGFYSLAMRAGTDHPVYGVQSQSLLAGEPGLLRLEDQAAYYLSEIRKVQPKGPYYLLGYCFGAKVAVEIAQQLQALGDRVELLGLIDAWQREWVQVIRRKGTVPLSIKQRIARFFGNFAPLSPLAKAAYLPGRLAVRVLPWVYLLGPSLGLRSVPSFMKRPEDINRAAGMNYRLKPWPGKVTLFRASIQPDPRFPRDLGWTKFARDGVEVCDLPGDHDNAFQEPNIQVLAEQVRARLERSDGQPTELCEDEFSVK